jgi:hypothetical protein
MADTTPEGYTALAADTTGASKYTYYYATFSSSSAATTTSPGTGLALGTTIDTSATVTCNNCSFSKNAGSSWSTSGFVSPNDTVYVRAISGDEYSFKKEVSLTIGTVTQSFDLITEGNGYGIEAFDDDGYITFTTDNSIAAIYQVVSGTLSAGTTQQDITLSTNEIPTTATVIDLTATANLFADPEDDTIWGTLINVSGTKKLRLNRTSSVGSTPYKFAIVGTELLGNY